MRELKILLIVIIFTGITYWGVEPLAHSVFHPHTPDADYTFKDVDGLNGVKGDASKGAEIATNCIGCHSIKSAGFEAPMSANDAAATYGVVPPDLSTAAKIYDHNYLAAFIKNPAVASKVAHKFDGVNKVHPMPGYDYLGNEAIADLIAYLGSIAPKDISAKAVFEDACSRCHSMKYAKISSTTQVDVVSKYMGSTPPDLSMMIRSRGDEYLHKFINDPQKLLHGTSMPRVGLTKESEEKVVEFMTQTGDSKKDERESLGPKVLMYLAILAVFAYLWKVKIWREVH
ncbi:MAG: cytochrome c1 [Campylobacterales bacterium]|nr:cytochrome c1 [Campylobacterales bacterium]